MAFEGNWLKLARCPVDVESRAQMYNNNIIAIIDLDFSDEYDGNNAYKLLRYDINNDEFMEWMECCKDGIDDSSDPPTITCDAQNLYISEKSHLVIIDLKNGHRTIVSKYAHHTLTDVGTAIVVNNKIHILGETHLQQQAHIIYDIIDNQFTVKPFPLSFGEFLHINSHQMMHIRSQHMILFFPGNNIYGEEPENVAIGAYDVIKNEWILLDVGYRKTETGFGCVMTDDDKYILIFDDAQIKIMDVNARSFTLSDIKCPKNNISIMWQAFIIHDLVENDKLINGFFKECGKNRFVDLNVFPLALIHLITSFHCRSYVHLINSYDGKHWKILLGDILSGY